MGGCNPSHSPLVTGILNMSDRQWQHSTNFPPRDTAADDTATIQQQPPRASLSHHWPGKEFALFVRIYPRIVGVRQVLCGI